MGMALTMKATREACARLLVVRSQIRALRDEESTLTSNLRPALSSWGPIRVTDTETVYAAEGSLRKTFNQEHALDLLRTLGATDAQIQSCYSHNATAPSIRERKPRPTDR